MTGNYYYANGEKIPISPREDLIAVKFRSRTPSGLIEQLAQSRQDSLEPASEFPELQQGSVRLFRVTNDGAADRSRARGMVSRDASVEAVGQVVTTARGEVLMMTDELIVKFQPLLKMQEIEQFVAQAGTEIVRPIEFDENTFVLRLTSGEKRANDVANELIEQGKAIYAHPNFVQNVGARVVDTMTRETRETSETDEADVVRHGVHATDPQFANQWHLDNTGQIAGGVAGTPGADARVTLAWQTTMGNPAIRVGVVDLGTDIAHADLNGPGKTVAPLDLTVSPPDANPVGSSHGTQVAGMAVATANNGVAVAGVAPNCRVIPVRVSDPLGTQEQMARGFVYAAEQGADVITCSLGPSNTAWTMTDVLRAGIDYATSFGRNGRGSVYTQAVDNNPIAINIDQVSSYERAIAVGRTNNRDLHDGSAMGPELDISAPGASVTMITNTTPTNNGTTTVSTGTSFATPLTAGVASLVLSVNPNLSWAEVRQVLLDSADKIDAAANPYAPAPAALPPGTRNNRYGYGRVNAQGAVAGATAPAIRDLFIRDTPADTGSVPQPAYGFWDSPDIWIRNADDNGTAHQETIRGRDNFIYARISNRGVQASHPCWVNFFITSFAGTEFRYPFDYKLDTTSAPGGGTPGRRRPLNQFPAVGTYLLETVRLQSVPGSGNTIAKVRWPAALIPPDAGWHPCLLLEVSPHDGPNAPGPYVWDNNNLAQKNISIRNARPGERLSFPFMIGHPLMKGLQQTVVVNKLKAPRNMNIAFSTAKPEVINSVASINDLLHPRPFEAAVLQPPRPQAAGGLPAISTLPFKMTFLEEARVVLSRGDRQGGDTLVLTFPPNSAIELGSASAAPGGPVEADDESGLYKEPEPDSNSRAKPFELTTIENRPALLMNPALKQVHINLPAGQAQQQESTLTVDVPRDAKPGDQYLFDVEQRDAQGVRTGGVRLMVNVVAER